MVPPYSGCGCAISAMPRGAANCAASGRSSAHSIGPETPARENRWVCAFMAASDFQAFDHLAADQVGLDDFIDVAVVDEGVPGSLRIDHQHRAFLAAVEAAGLVDADLALAVQVQLLDALFRMFLRG